MPVVEFRVGDVLELRKAHPCGSARWTVVRIGADIGLVCGGCAHRVTLERRLLERRLLERRLQGFVERGGASQSDAGG